jgi:cysteine desulfurase
MFRLRREVYLDNNATTKVAKRVQEKMASVLKLQFGNPSSIYQAGRNAAAVVEDAREAVAGPINANTEEIIFTSGATEANNHILRVLAEVQPSDKQAILASPIEHPSVKNTLAGLEQKGFIVKFFPVDNKGRALIDKLEALIDEQTFLICCMLANNELGTIQDLSSISRIVKEHNLLLFSDCVQAIGKIPLDIKALGIDYASFSAHKLHGPKGVGALYIRQGAPFAPFILGGHQEQDRRAGTESVHNIVGFGEACRAVSDLLNRMKVVADLRNRFLEGLKEIKPELIVNTALGNTTPNTLNITFPGVSNAELMAVLDLHGICVSAGSACNSAGNEPSHVLKAIGLSDTAAQETIRFSLSTETTQKEIDYTLRIIREFAEGRMPTVNVLKASHVNRDFLNNDENYILDVRFGYERALLKGLPNSHEVSLLSFKRYIHHFPRDKNILVVCMGGVDATAIAYRLRDKGYKNVSLLLGGVIAWRIAQVELYSEMAGTNITKLEPD